MRVSNNAVTLFAALAATACVSGGDDQSSTITARRTSGSMPMTTYHCPDGSSIDAWYPTTSTARIVYQDRTIEMTSVVSASGARYVGGGWQWWTKGTSEGMLSPLAEGESIASAEGITCSAT